MMGWTAIWICVVLYFFNFISMLYVFFRELRHAYRMYSVKRKFILQYSRKSMIDQNYFKSSRDNGPKSKLKAKKLAGLTTQSSRDDGSPRKENRRRRRREAEGKSGLVTKNDIDDVYDPDSDSGYSEQTSQNQKHTREYMRKLRDAETAHNLQQIAEVEGEDSGDSSGDDPFGPVEGAGQYGLVSNRSSHRGGPSSQLLSDNARSADNEFLAPVGDADDKSVASSS